MKYHFTCEAQIFFDVNGVKAWLFDNGEIDEETVEDEDYFPSSDEVLEYACICARKDKCKYEFFSMKFNEN